MKCTSCGGELVYSIANRNLFCRHCDQSYSLDQFDTNRSFNGEENRKSYEVDVYECEGCGAELTAPTEQIVAYCAYCGGQAMLKERSAFAERPKLIIPFVKTKEDAAKVYGEKINNLPYLPKEFKDASFLEEFRGIYIPYWRKEYKVEMPSTKIPATKDYTSGSYDVHETYEIAANFDGNKECSYDASFAFDDTVAAEIAPFHIQHGRDFHEGYLAGFYADRVTVPSETYDEIAAKSVTSEIKEDLASRTGVTPDSGAWEKSICVDKQKDEVALFPIWFLTWRRGNRVAYSVVNGQTGKVSVDLPIDYQGFFKCVGIWAVIFFILLCILPIYMLPVVNSAVSGLLLLFTSMLFAMELKHIDWMENHKYDVGYQQIKHKEKLEKAAQDEAQIQEEMSSYRKQQAGSIFRKKKSVEGVTRAGSGSEVSGGTVVMIILLLIFGFYAFSVETPSGLQIFLGFMSFFQMIYSAIVLVRAVGVRNKLATLSAIMSAAIMLMSTWVAGPQHPHDYWYYGISVGCLTGMVLNMLASIYYINYLTTRPVPNFFTREGANNAKKDY